jgi:hypothetical protein
MGVIIAETFTRSLGYLTAIEQAAVKQTAFEFQINPAAPGFNFEALERPKDPNFRSIRVNQDLRIIVHQLPNSTMLCYVDHHDKAYQWAERRKIAVHPTTGAAQIVEVVEREVVQTIVRTQQPALFARHEPEYLLAIGVPPEWLDVVRSVDEGGLEKLIGRLPEEAMERLMELAMGNPVPRPAKLATVSPMTHPDAQRRFRLLENQREFQQALEYPWEKWIVFLHPSQRRMVERNFHGPSSVTGSAGTGKSVVGLHRAAWLASRHPNSRVLLTTFSRTLAVRLAQALDVLLGPNSSERARIDVEHLHKIARDLWVTQNSRPLEILSGKELASLVDEARDSVDHGLFSSAFLRAEWNAIIDPQGINDWDSYRAAPRTRRGTALGARQKLAAWRVFERVRSLMLERGFSTWDSVCYDVAASLKGLDDRAYDHVVVDEAQDFGPAELGLLRALTPAGDNDLFLCGDVGQRIYFPGFSWLSLGIDTRGRSSRLKLNYRTTEPIRRFADRLLPGAIGGSDGELEARDSISLLNGPDPEVHVCRSAKDESNALGEWVKSLLEDGYKPNDIAIFARTDALASERAYPALAPLTLGAHKLSDDEPPTGDDVFLGTMHRAKGLEFRAVAVIAVGDVALPLRSVLDSLEDHGDKQEFIDQERRLLYVACTRARERLFLSCTGIPTAFLASVMASGSVG